MAEADRSERIVNENTEKLVAEFEDLPVEFQDYHSHTKVLGDRADLMNFIGELNYRLAWYELKDVRIHWISIDMLGIDLNPLKQ